MENGLDEKENKKLKLLIKITENRDTLKKIIEMVTINPDIDLFLTASIVNRDKKIRVTEIEKHPFGHTEKEVLKSEEIQVKERIDPIVLLELAPKWLFSLERRREALKEELLKL